MKTTNSHKDTPNLQAAQLVEHPTVLFVDSVESVLPILRSVVKRAQHVRLHRGGQVLGAHPNVFLLRFVVVKCLLERYEVLFHFDDVAEKALVVFLDFAEADSLPVRLHFDRASHARAIVY